MRSHSVDYPDRQQDFVQGGEMIWCQHPFGCLTGCDEIKAIRNLDIDTNGTDSWTFCVKRNLHPISATKIKVTFEPELDSTCNHLDWDGKRRWDFKEHCTPSMNGGSPCPFVWRGDTIWIPANDSIHIQDDEWRMTLDSVGGGKQFLEFTPAPSYSLSPCGTWCFEVKDCPLLRQQSRKIKIETDSPTDPSTDCADSITKSFKPVGADEHYRESGKSNYPNPFGPHSGNATIIPFSAPATGRALITITNEAGSFLLIQEIEVTTKGEQKFEFEAGELPAGKYFYQIELPKGNVLLKRSMLYVK